MDVNIEKVFNLFANKKNILEAKDITNALRCCGLILPEKIIYGSDLTFENFKKLYEEYCINNKENIEKAFKLFDKDSTGYIKESDLRNALSSGRDLLTKDEISEFFGRLDSDDKGMIAYNLLIEKFFDD